MRYHDIINELFDPAPHVQNKLLAKAEADGFDVSKFWYHGTKKQFSKFRLPKTSGIDELGRGIYLAQQRGRANPWALGAGQILICVIKPGPLKELSELSRSIWDRPPVWEEVYEGYEKYMTDLFGPDSTPEFHEFAERINRGKIKLADCLSALGFIGATNRHSQIRGQVVIWNPDDVRIIGRMPGVDDWIPDDE